MQIDDFSPNIDSSQELWDILSSSIESTEKSREKDKKSQAWVKRIQKDEKKARKYDIALAWFLVKIILDKKYDFILLKLFNTLDNWYPSNFILWILSLINTELSNKIREISNKEYIEFNYQKSENSENIEFNNNNLPKDIKKRINFWIEDIIDACIIDYSEVQIKNIINNLENDNKIIIDYTSSILTLFLNEIKIEINSKEANSIAIFIIEQVLKSSKKIISI